MAQRLLIARVKSAVDQISAWLIGSQGGPLRISCFVLSVTGPGSDSH